MEKLLAEWFYTDRWMGSSAFLLPMEARGLYREMLTQAWRRGGRLPRDPEMIQRATGCTAKEWRRNWPKIERYWRVDGDTLVNDTQVDIYEQSVALRQSYADRGRKGGLAKASSATAQLVAEGVAGTCTPSPSPKEEEKTIQEKKKRPDSAPKRAASTSWITPYQEDWQKRFDGGCFNIGQACAALGPLRARHTDAVVRPVWQFYLQDDQPEYVNPITFAQKFAHWRERMEGGSSVLHRIIDRVWEETHGQRRAETGA